MPLLALTALALVPAALGQACPRGFVMLTFGEGDELTQQCYLVGHRAPTFTYQRATDWCTRKGATLATFESDEEYESLRKLLIDNEGLGQGGADYDYWLGLDDIATEGTFTWANGVDYDNGLEKDWDIDTEDQFVLARGQTRSSTSDAHCAIMASATSRFWKSQDLKSGPTRYLWKSPRCDEAYTARALCKIAAECPEGFTKQGTGCYLVAHEEATMSKAAARQYCADRMAFLVTISSTKEQEQIENLIPVDSGSYWIGLSDVADEDALQDNKDTFLWDSGERATFRAWIDGSRNINLPEPETDVTLGEAQDCVYMDATARPTYSWGDMDCNDADTNKPICETGHPGNFASKYRLDGRCGAAHPLIDGAASQCNPNNRGGNACCSNTNWCGLTVRHCDCDDCVDFSVCSAANDGVFRLVGATDDADAVSHGRVEVCKQFGQRFEWSTICDNGFDAVDAEVICNNLGFSISTYFYGEVSEDYAEGGKFHRKLPNVVNKAYGPGDANQPICEWDVANDVLGSCQLNPSDSTCTHNEDVAIKCK